LLLESVLQFLLPFGISLIPSELDRGVAKSSIQFLLLIEVELIVCGYFSGPSFDLLFELDVVGHQRHEQPQIRILKLVAIVLVVEVAGCSRIVAINYRVVIPHLLHLVLSQARLVVCVCVFLVARVDEAGVDVFLSGL